MHQHLRLTWTRFDYSWSSRIAALTAPVSHGISGSPDLSPSHSLSPHASGDTRHGTPARSKRPGSSSGILRGRNGASEPGMSVEDTLVNIRPPDEAPINRHHLRMYNRNQNQRQNPQDIPIFVDSTAMTAGPGTHCPPGYDAIDAASGLRIC